MRTPLPLRAPLFRAILSARMTFSEFLRQQTARNLPVFMDGGIGTMIQKSGATDFSIPEDLNLSRPDIIKSIHRQYLEAGSNVLTANSFGLNPLKDNESRYQWQDSLVSSIKLQIEAIAEFNAAHPDSTEPRFCSWDTGQIGKLLEPMGTVTFDNAYEAYKEAALVAEQAGAQVAILETMSDLYELKAAVLAVKENTHLPVIASATFQSSLRTLTGADALTVVTYLEALRPDIIGFNCGGSLQEDAELARQFCSYSHTPVLIQPNAGLPVQERGRTVFKVPPDEFARCQLENYRAGARILGGCCGTTPSHISAMIQSVRNEGASQAGAPLPQSSCLICSYNKTVEIGGEAGPQIVGERINPTGKKKCREALLAGDMQFVLDEAESQISAGAQILDVNTGLPGIDESETMRKAVFTIQGAFNTPLQIDSSEPHVLENALRHYNGKALVNSVNGKQEVMDAVLPLVQKYGGAVVALTIDEAGIAPTAEGRVAVAEKIIAEAAKYGIPMRDILIDTLTLTVSSQQKEALETVRAISILNGKYGAQGLRFILGVSNISFGLPRREIVNSRFLGMALYAGLSACIINPLSEAMMDTYRAYRALAGHDTNCLDYIGRYTGTTAPQANGAATQNHTAQIETEALPAGVRLLPEQEEFIDVICKGFKDKAPECARKLLAVMDSVAIIDSCIVPALDIVGKDYESGRKFLPQLLLSADTVSAAFDVIKRHLAASGAVQESKGTVVLATVHGDIHDIGKNIVRAMLENYGYTVLDLGKNVPPEAIVAAVLEHGIRLLGLSALMTTTVASMERTIALLRKELCAAGKDCKVMAGGAVLTEDYALRIGADFYAKDAMASVAIARQVFA